MRDFWKAVGAGTLAGAALPLCLTVPMGVINFFQPMTPGIGPRMASFTIALAPVLICLPVVLIASLVIGLPLTWALERSRFGAATRHMIYVLTGFIAGIGIPAPFTPFDSRDGMALAPCLLGAFSGSITAFVWTKARETRTAPLP